MNIKLHAVADADGRPIRFFMTAGQVSDYTGAARFWAACQRLLADRGHDADWFRDALKDKGIKPCIPGRKSRGKPVKHDKRRYKCRNRIEIMFGRLKDWRRVATRYETGAPRSSSPPSPSPQPSCSGYDARTSPDPSIPNRVFASTYRKPPKRNVAENKAALQTIWPALTVFWRAILAAGADWCSSGMDGTTSAIFEEVAEGVMSGRPLMHKRRS